MSWLLGSWTWTVISEIGDLVWVKDVKNGRPIAIGKALMDGPIMASKAPGKAIKNLHFVGDKLWKVDDDS